MQNYQDYFFEKQSEVLFIDEDTQRVGILKDAPQYTLDVLGDISGSNVITTNIIANNGLINTVMSSNIISGDVETETIQTTSIFSQCNISQSNFNEYIEANLGVINDIHCSSLVAYSNINCLSNVVIGSNLAILNTYLNHECPLPNQGTILGWSLGGGWIHPSWIQTESDFTDTLQTLFDLAQTGYDLYDAISKLVNTDNTIADELKNQLDDALNGGDSNDQNKLYVDWGNLRKKPIYADKTNYNVGIKGNLYIGEGQSIYSLNSAYLSLGNELNLNMTSTSNANKILDVGTKEFYANTINVGSNIYLSVNSNVIKLNHFNLSNNSIINSNVNITFSNNSVSVSTLNTSNITTSNVKIGNYTITTDGIYIFYDDLLQKQKIIDTNGKYLSTITKSQITDLEALNLNALTDGVLQWTPYSSITNQSYIDPFANITTPIYEIY